VSNKTVQFEQQFWEDGCCQPLLNVQPVCDGTVVICIFVLSHQYSVLMLLSTKSSAVCNWLKQPQ